MNILLIEDNLSIIKGLKYAFTQQDYNLDYLTSVQEVIEYLEIEHKIDIIILDITLPDGNGFDLYKDHLKHLNIPTIFLTAKDDEDDIVLGLNLGAEDYITKPFSTKELIARLNKIVIRNKKQVIKIKDLEYDYDKMILTRDHNIIELSSLELKLLNLLFENINKVVTRSMILDKIWLWTGNDVDDHTITVYLKRLREKIKTDIIITVKGIGYRIDEDK